MQPQSVIDEVGRCHILIRVDIAPLELIKGRRDLITDDGRDHE